MSKYLRARIGSKVWGGSHWKSRAGNFNEVPKGFSIVVYVNVLLAEKKVTGTNE